MRTLAVPNLDARVRPADIERVPATALFVDRARMVRPEFALNEDSARSVAEICVRLDGLPLAIEMAAAQVKYLTPETILRELDRSTGSLASSVRNLPDRHRTLHACIAWSYVLLAPVQQTHLRTIAVFRGGFTAGAAEAVAGGDAASACRGVLTALVDKGLAEMAPQSDGTPRLAILETIREFALELSNRAIAAELGVGRRTVDTHVRHILRRLGFRSRVQIGVWMASRSPLR